MENQAELSIALEQLIGKHNRGNILVEGIVKVVNSDNTCDVTIGEATQFSVPLRVLTGAQASVYEVPVQGTDCLVTFRDGNINRPQIIYVHEVEKLLINCRTLVEFNGGELGGMVKVEDLVTRLNKLEQDLNVLKQVFTTWVPVPNDGGSALKIGSATWAGSELIVTVKSDVENTKITQ